MASPDAYAVALPIELQREHAEIVGDARFDFFPRPVLTFGHALAPFVNASRVADALAGETGVRVHFRRAGRAGCPARRPRGTHSPKPTANPPGDRHPPHAAARASAQLPQGAYP